MKEETTHNRGPHKPPRVADGIEEGECFLHTVDVLVLVQHLVILAQSNQEDQRSDILETMDPLFSLRPLTAYIEQAVGELTDAESGLGNAGRLDTGAKNILISGHIPRASHAVNRVKVAVTASSVVPQEQTTPTRFRINVLSR